MLTEYRFRNGDDVLQHFMDDEPRAAKLTEDGKIVECRKANPFRVRRKWDVFNLKKIKVKKQDVAFPQEDKMASRKPKLTIEQINEIKLRKNESTSKLAKEFGVTPATVNYHKNRAIKQAGSTDKYPKETKLIQTEKIKEKEPIEGLQPKPIQTTLTSAVSLTERLLEFAAHEGLRVKINIELN